MNNLAEFLSLGMTEREAARFVAKSRGHENAAEALGWMIHALITVGNRDQLGVMTGALAVERVREMVSGRVEFRDDDPNLPRLPLMDVMSVLDGAEELCNLILQRLNFHLGN